MQNKSGIVKDCLAADENVRLGPDPRPGEAPAALADPGARFDVRNPLQIIEYDLVSLMQANAQLTDQLDKERDRCVNRMKKLLLSLLPVLDGFDAMFQNLKEREEALEQQTKLLAGNFRTVWRKLSLALERMGVTPMDVNPGTLASPFRHEVVETKAAPGIPDGTILEVIQTGYLWNEVILRHPLVVTAKKSQEKKHG